MNRQRLYLVSVPVPAPQWRILAGWFLVGMLAAGALQWLTAAKYGGDWTAVLNVGVDAEVRELVEKDLGSVAPYPLEGHDGRFSYVVARDPWGTRGWLQELDAPAVRYRRWLYSALASAFGLLGPRGTFVGLLVWSAVAMGLATAATADLGRLLQARSWSPLAVLTNVGVIASVTLSTSDTLALAFLLMGICLYLRGRVSWAVFAVAVAVLAKETYAVGGAGLALYAVWQGRRLDGAWLLGGPALAGALLVLHVHRVLPGYPMDNGGLAFPLSGYIQAIPLWLHFTARFVSFLPATIGLLGSLFVAWRVKSRLLLCLSLPWFGLGFVSSWLVWRSDGHRVFAASWVFLILGLAMYFVQRDRTSTPPPKASLDSDKQHGLEAESALPLLR